MQHIILKSIYGKLSDEEQAQLDLWLQKSGNSTIYRNIKGHLDGDVDMIEVMDKVDIEGVLARVKSRYNNVQDPKSGVHSFSLRRWAAAACVAGIVMIGAAWWYKDYTHVTPPEVSQEVMVAMQKCKASDRMFAKVENTNDSESAEKKHLTTPDNKEYWLTLDDGTIVHLNNNSRINYPERFNRDSREVTLEGEAYFMVSKDKSRPFIVHTKRGDVTVYGTEFNVSTVSNTEVVLVHGSVGVTTPEGSERMLQPGQKADISRSITVSNVDTAPYVAWNQGRFFFREWTLQKIMDVIARWYERKVIFTDESCRNQRFSGNFERYDDIRPMIDAISSATGMDIQINTNEIIISKNK